MSFNEYTNLKSSNLVSITSEEDESGKKFFLEYKRFSPVTGEETLPEKESVNIEALLKQKAELQAEIAGINQAIKDIEAIK